MSRYVMVRGIGRFNKYGVSPKEQRTVNGIVYHSKAEANRAVLLDLLVRAGHVIRWERQQKFHLGVLLNAYVADFVVWDELNAPHAEDVKGFQTTAFKRNVRLWREYGPMPLWILRPGGRNRWNVEIVPPGKDSTHAQKTTQ